MIVVIYIFYLVLVLVFTDIAFYIVNKFIKFSVSLIKTKFTFKMDFNMFNKMKK